MKTKKSKAISGAKTQFTSKQFLGTMAAAILPLTAASVKADDAATPTAAPPPSRVHALVNFQFANEYVTPRGMIVRDQGLTIQPLLLGFVNLYKSDSFINSITLIPGVWNDLGSHAIAVHAPYNSQPTTPWTEIDPIAGVEVGFAKNFTLDVTYTAFVEQILDIGTSQHLDTKLSFDDSSYLKGFGFHPYAEFWLELSGKGTDADVPYLVDPLGKNAGTGPGSSYYFEVGIDPTYTFNKLGGLKLEAPIDMQLPNSRFYGEYYSSASTVSLFDAGLKATLPLNFMPQGYGHWSINAGFKYMYFVDDNLYHLNTFNAPGKPTRDTCQVFAGISIFF
jgi:hypothetical protein